MTGINKTPPVVSSSPKTFIQLCEDLAAKRAAGKIPPEQIEAMDTFRKGLTSGYRPQKSEGLDDLRETQAFRSGMNPDGDYFEKSTQEA